MFVLRIPLIMLQYPPLSVRTFPAPSLRELARLQASLRECLFGHGTALPQSAPLTAPSPRGPGARRMAGRCGHLGEVSLHPRSHIHRRGRSGTPRRPGHSITPFRPTVPWQIPERGRREYIPALRMRRFFINIFLRKKVEIFLFFPKIAPYIWGYLWYHQKAGHVPDDITMPVAQLWEKAV